MCIHAVPEQRTGFSLDLCHRGPAQGIWILGSIVRRRASRFPRTRAIHSFTPRCRAVSGEQRDELL
jgi:hypothetical protein